MSPEMEKLIDEKMKNDFDKWAFNEFLNNSCVDYANIPWFIRCTGRGLDASRFKSLKSNTLVVGMCGNMGTGKDSALNFLMKFPELKCVKFAFADPIREIGKIFGFTMEQMTRRDLKEALDDFWNVSPRWFMQRVGTEMFRKQWRDDVWIALAHKRICDLILKNPRVIFISDVRFPNEAEFIHSIGGLVVRVQRDGFSKTGENLHDSEKFINSVCADLVIRNEQPNADRWSWYFTETLTKFLSGKNPYSGFDDRGKREEN